MPPGPGDMLRPGKKKKEDEEQWTTVGSENVEALKAKESCIVCKQRVNSGERGIKCDLCRRWYHSDCQGVAKKDYDLMSRMDAKVKWFCVRCDGKMDDISEGYRKLEQKVEVVESQLIKVQKEAREKQQTMEQLVEEVRKLKLENVERWRNIRGDLEKIELFARNESKAAWEENNKMVEVLQREAGRRQESKLLALREEVEEIKKSKTTAVESDQDKEKRKQEIEKIKQEVVNRGVEEVRKTIKNEGKVVQEISHKIEEIEKESKKKNIVMFNLPESTEDLASNRYQEDMERCGKIFTRELEIQDLTVEKTIRLGKKKDNGNRPLLIKLGSETDRNTVLSKAKKLRYSEEFVRVYLAKDMTEMEREKDKKLRQELIEKRRQKEDGWYVIRRGKVMKIQQEESRGAGARSEQDF